MMAEKKYMKFKVEMKSIPGMLEHYSGSVSVWATDPESAVEQAFIELKRGAFPERSRSTWRVLNVAKEE